MKDYSDESNLEQPALENAPGRADPTFGSEIYQRLVMEVRDYAIFMLDREGVVRTWNAGAERLKGYKPNEIIGQHFSRFYPEEDVRAGKPDWELKEALKNGRIEDEGWRIRKDGARFWANVVITAIYDDRDRHIGFAKVTRDLTERRAAEQADREELERRVEERTAALGLANQDLARANEELQRVSRMKDEFLAVLSHELRTPLTAIYGWLSLLQAGKVDDSRLTEVLEIIGRNVRAQTQLIDDLLNVSRIITGNLRIAPRWIDPLTVINAAVDSIRPAAMAKQIHISIQADPGDLVFADPDRLQQVIWNLLSNAVKFTDKNGEIRVEAGRIASKFQVSISDTGEGVAPEYLPYVFDPFSQADSSTKRKAGGLGLGLSIVRHIVEMHGGVVFAHSEGKGQGTTIIIRLPVPPIRPDSAPDEVKRTDVASLKGLRVVLVEDEPDSRAMLQEALESYGASVRATESAAAALEEIVKSRPDLLVSDIGLPGVDGYELLAKVRSELPGELRHIPAVALSAYASLEYEERSKRAGYQAHIAKPIAIQNLVEILAGIVRS